MRGGIVMKKKLMTGITACVMLCGLLTAPVSAEKFEPQLGDVNFDGVVDVADAQLILHDFTALICRKKNGYLTDAQRELGNVDGEVYIDYRHERRLVSTDPIRYERVEVDPIPIPADVVDAQMVLYYYCGHLVDPNVTLQEVSGRTEKAFAALDAFKAKYRMYFDPETGAFTALPRDET